MSETEEGRRLRKEKKREAARRAAEHEGTSRTKSSAGAGEPRQETEEERRARKEKKRALREAGRSTEDGTTKRENRQHRAASASTSIGGGALEQQHQKSAPAPSNVEAPPPPKRTKSSLANDDLLRAIAAENEAVVARSSTPPPPAGGTAGGTASKSRAEGGDGAAEERSARKTAEREERRRARHEAKAVAAAAKEGSAVEGGEAIFGAAGVATPSPAPSVEAGELQRQAYRAQFQKDLARATALRRLVDLDGSGGVVLDLAPQTAYDLYIRDFGQSGRAQASVQAPPEEERLDVGTQAERSKLRTKGAQAPADLGLCPEAEAERQFFQFRQHALARTGRSASSPREGGTAVSASVDASTAVAGDGAGEEEGAAGGASGSSGATSIRAVDAALLERFLSSALPVMSAVLDENNASSKGAAAAAVAAAALSNNEGDGKAKAAAGFSTSYTNFCWRCTRSRPLLQVQLNPSNPRQLLALHDAAQESGPSPILDAYASVLLLWNVHDTTNPERVLVSFSGVTSVCVSPSRPHLIYGGTMDGNVCVWSLREPDRLHRAAGRFEKSVFRLPSFCTSWQADGHDCAVRQVRVAGYNARAGARKDEQEQLVSMDARGHVCYWAVQEREGVVSVGDCGQQPYTAVRLHLAKGGTAPSSYASAAADVTNALGAESEDASYAAAITAGFDFVPTDGAQFVFTAPHGVVRCSRYGGLAAPSLYAPACPTYLSTDSDVLKAQASVVPCCVQYSELDPRWFVVGYEDGTVRLYLHQEACPQLTVEVGYHPIIAIRCSAVTPWVVWALDDSGEVHMIDLAHHTRRLPRLSHTLSQPDTGLCTCMDVASREEKADQRVLAAGFEKGMVQLHVLDADRLRFANAERDEKWL